MSLRFPVVMLLGALGLAAGSAAAENAALKIDPAPAVAAPKAGMHRYMVVRTFPAGALAGVGAEGKKKINTNNASNDVRWVHSYANADKTKTFCIYEGPSEQAVRDAAKANNSPVDYIVEVPVVLLPR